MATPGPGVAALVARVLGQGLKGVAPFIAGYFVADMIWLTFAATGLAVVAKTFAGVFVAIKFAGAAYLLYLAWRMATAPAAVEAAPTAGHARLARVLILVVVDAGQPEGDGLLPLDHAARRRLEDADRVGARRTCRRLRDRDLLDARALRIRRKPGATLLRSTRAMRFVNRAAGGLMAGAAVAVATR